MSNVAINIAAEFTGKKAFKQAETSTDKLGKSVKKLAGALGLAFGARAMANYGKNAVKAFAEDEKAAKSLTLTLNNLGMAFANPEVTKFISNLESQFGVLDDQLRPAYQKLLTSTGDYKKSQDLLRTSLDLAAMSGSDVVSVSNDIARAYAGNTRGLIKYGLGLDKAEIAAMSFEEILQQIAVVSAGQAQSAADSYSGSLDRLNVSAANASETIGKGLIDAIGTLAGGDGLPKTIELIENLSASISRGLVLTARLIRNISILAAGNPLESLRDLRAATKADQLEDRQATANYGGIYATVFQAQAKVLAGQIKITKLTKDQAANQAKILKDKKLQAALDKANLALGKGGEVFDMDKIQIAAALTSQAEALGKATSSSQILQIANDVARLNVKKSILALEDAIAAKDEAAIIAATNKLNADLKVLGTLGAQNLKLQDIKSILDTLKPADLINQANLDEALRKIKEMLALLAMTPTKQAEAASKISSFKGSTASAFASLTPSEQASLGGYAPFVGSNISNLPPTSSFGSGAGLGNNGSGMQIPAAAGVTIVVNTGIGDPNAIAEAIENVMRSAQDRGTLRAV